MSSQYQQPPVANHGGGVQSTSRTGTTVNLGRNAGKLDPKDHPPLPIEQVGEANRTAQARGLALGAGAGLMSGFISRRGLSLSKNASFLSGFLTAIGVAYVTARQRLEHNLALVENAERGLRGVPGQQPSSRDTTYTGSTTDADMLKYDMQAASHPSHEAGVGGLHNFQDRYATTRGDH